MMYLSFHNTKSNPYTYTYTYTFTYSQYTNKMNIILYNYQQNTKEYPQSTSTLRSTSISRSRPIFSSFSVSAPSTSLTTSLTITLTLALMIFLSLISPCQPLPSFQLFQQLQYPYPSNTHPVIGYTDSTINATIIKPSHLDILLYIYKYTPNSNPNTNTNFYDKSQKLPSTQTTISSTKQQLIYDATQNATYVIVVMPVVLAQGEYRISIRVNGLEFYVGEYWMSIKYWEQVVGYFVADGASSGSSGSSGGGMCMYRLEIQFNNITDSIESIQLIYGELNAAPTAMYIPSPKSTLTSTLTYTQILHKTGTYYIRIKHKPLLAPTSLNRITISISADTQLYYLHKYPTSTGTLRTICSINCTSIPKASNLQPYTYTDTCNCEIGYIWDNQFNMCRVDCLAIKNVVGYVRNNAEMCVCEDRFQYQPAYRMCKIKCETIENTNVASANRTVKPSEYDVCECKSMYKWNQYSYRCERTKEFISSVKYSVVVGFIAAWVIFGVVAGYLGIMICRMQRRVELAKMGIGVGEGQVFNQSTKILAQNTFGNAGMKQGSGGIGNTKIGSLTQLKDEEDGNEEKQNQENYYAKITQNDQKQSKIIESIPNQSQRKQINTSNSNLVIFNETNHQENNQKHEKKKQENLNVNLKKINQETHQVKVEAPQKQKIQQPQNQDKDEVNFNKVIFQQSEEAKEDKINKNKEIIQTSKNCKTNSNQKMAKKNFNKKQKDQESSVSYQSDD